MICFSCGEETETLISGYCSACNRERKRWASGMYEHYAELRVLASQRAYPEEDDGPDAS